MNNPIHINCEAVVNHLAEKYSNDFEKRRNEAEYNRMVDYIREISSEPVSRWPKESKTPKK